MRLSMFAAAASAAAAAAAKEETNTSTARKPSGNASGHDCLSAPAATATGW